MKKDVDHEDNDRENVVDFPIGGRRILEGPPPPVLDDPLEDLLNEFKGDIEGRFFDLEELEELLEDDVSDDEDFISSKFAEISAELSSTEILSMQLESVRNINKRLSYYISEIDSSIPKKRS